MCEVLGVSKSGYYYWKKELQGSKKTEELDNIIKDAFAKSRETYGSPKIYKKLKKQGVKESESKVCRRMKALGLSPKSKKKFKVTTDSNHDGLIAPNVLDRAFNPEELSTVWVSDITYIKVRDTFVYLTTVINLADRMVVGWNLSDNVACPDALLGDGY